MIKLFTRKFLVTDWSEDLKNSNEEEQLSTSDLYAPSEETVSMLKNFARSFTVDLSRDSLYTMPMA